MGDYLPIARAYLCKTSVAVWCFLLLCLLAMAACEGEFARQPVGILNGVLSRKSYLAMFAYFNACLLGVLLTDNIAHPWASVLPNYRQKHLLVTTFIAVMFIGTPMMLMQFVGPGDIASTSVAIIFLTCLAAGLWTLKSPFAGYLVFPFLAFVFVPATSFPALATFLAGTSPAASLILALASLLALGTLARQLLVMNEDNPEYAMARMRGDLLRGQSPTKIGDDYFNSLPADKRAALQAFDPQKAPFTNLKQVDNLSAYAESSLWQCLQLWRLGTAPTRTYGAVAGLVLLTLIMIAIAVSLPKLAATDTPGRNTVLIFSVQAMMNPFSVWLFWFQRRHRLGYESLRPRTRQAFVRELGLALMWDVFQSWLGGILCLGIAAAIWAPELLQFNNMLPLVVCTAASQLCLYALIVLWLFKQGTFASICCAVCAFMVLALWMIASMNGGIAIAVNLAIASVLAAGGLEIISLAYRRWCLTDLD